MAAAEGPVLARLARLGLGAVQPRQGLTALQRVLQSMTVPTAAGVRHAYVSVRHASHPQCLLAANVIV